MKCMQHSISQSLSEAYAHHIQRLMVIEIFFISNNYIHEVDALVFRRLHRCN